MLVLTRKSGEEIRIGDDIRVRLIRVQGKRAVIGVEAPSTCRVLRAEIWSSRSSGPAPQLCGSEE